MRIPCALVLNWESHSPYQGSSNYTLICRVPATYNIYHDTLLTII